MYNYIIIIDCLLLFFLPLFFPDRHYVAIGANNHSTHTFYRTIVIYKQTMVSCYYLCIAIVKIMQLLLLLFLLVYENCSWLLSLLAVAQLH